MDCIWNFMGNRDFGRDYENASSTQPAQMDCVVVSDYGVDVAVYIAGYVA